MNTDERDSAAIHDLLETADLARALEDDRFKQFLDHMPFAIAVSNLKPMERLAYANAEFERLTGEAAAHIRGKCWGDIEPIAALESRIYGAPDNDDYVGECEIRSADSRSMVHMWSNVISGDDGLPMFRIVAAARVAAAEGSDDGADLDDLVTQLREKDTLLRELQHRVTNNLQMITALIRMEARHLREDAADDPFARLAGRVNALAALYRLLSENDHRESVDLGIYLNQIASAVMQAHAIEGIRLDLQVDSWQVSIDVAMPTGLVVNEIMTNALKHAFIGRTEGTVMLHALVDDDGCRVIVADDGIGLPPGTDWPQPGKLASLIVRSLKQNAKADIEIDSAPGEGVRVAIRFARSNAMAGSA